MTIKYALTKAEILKVFLFGLSKSPRLFAIILLFSLWPGFVWLITTGAFSHKPKFSDARVTLEWTAGAFCFICLWVFIRGKTAERRLTVAEEGISTEIGSIKAQLPWTRVKEVKDTGLYILIVGKSGNAFFVPSRAFSGSDQRNEFLIGINRWRRTA